MKRDASAIGENVFQELACLLARGYLRLVVFRASTSDPIAPPPEPEHGAPNCLDVAGRAKHELVPEGHP